jgi:hypothetical protein
MIQNCHQQRFKASTGGRLSNQQKYCYWALVLAGR